jgi:CBS domain-containing protein
MRTFDAEVPGVARPVLWTRGQGCRELAEQLSLVEPIRVTGDVADACVRHAAEVLVSRRATGSFDLVSVAAPLDFDPVGVEAVVAAVAGGPHSELAALVARRLGETIGVPATMVSAFREDTERTRAVATIDSIFATVPGLESRLVKAEDAADLFVDLPERTLVVVGAAGGGWLQRTFFGPGARLRQNAPAGAVVVRRQPDRVFQVMTDPVFVGPLREATDILRIHQDRVLAVVDRAVLIGIVRRQALENADPGVPVQDLMEPPLSVPLSASVNEAMELSDRFRGASIPVVDDDGRLVGALAVPAEEH